MAKDKKSFVAYCDWLETFEELTDEEAGKLVKHLFRYVNDKNPEAPDRLTKMCFIEFKRTLKRDLKKYEGYLEKQRENGKRGGRPKKPKKPNPLNENPTEPKKADSVSVNDNVNATVSDNEIKEDSMFDEFWEAYDKKTGRTNAEKKWSNLSQGDRELILQHVPKYVKATPDKQYRKNPTTYLNQKTWLDEDLPSNGKQESTGQDSNYVYYTDSNGERRKMVAGVL